LEDTIQCDFNSFNIVLFEVKWYRLRMHGCDPERTVIEHANGLTMVNTREFESGTKPYVLPSQCEKVLTHRYQVKKVGHMLLYMIQ